MKKVLIITYLFSQKEAIGSKRMQGLAKFLPEFGWSPTILTSYSKIRPDPRFRVVETPANDILAKWKRFLGLNLDKTLKEQTGLHTYKTKNTLIDRILNMWEEIFAYPDINIGWYNHALEAGNKLLEIENFDVIISTSPTSYLIAKELKKKFGLPWLADLRDLWTQNHYYSYGSFRKIIEKRLELKTFSSASALTTVSQPLAEKLKELHIGKNISTITNGFDPDEKANGIPLSDKFCITYTGFLYKGRRDPAPLFNALQQLIIEKVIDPIDIVIDFYGYDEGWLKRDIEMYGIQHVVNVHGLILREEAIKKQRESHLLLLLTWNNPNEKGVYTGKIFDYLAAQRPILSIGISGGVVAELLERTNAGVHVSSVDEIKREIKDAYFEYKSKGKVSYHGITSEIDKYSQKEMAKKFAELLNGIIK